MKKKITDIIDRILAGESSAADEIFLNEWLGENSDNLEEFAGREKLWNAIEIALKREKFDTGTAYMKFRSLINKPVRSNMPNQGRTKKLIRKTLRWAAIGLILLSAGSISTYMVTDFITNKRMTEQFVVKVPSGSRGNVTLADGSTVWLNAGSTLTYAQGYGSNERTVYLEGEGFFNVAKDRSKPFTVITSQLEIVALGTSFNVKSYPEENIIQATIISGSVMVSRNEHKSYEKGVVLEPNQQITFLKDSGELSLAREQEIIQDKEVTSSAEKTNTDTREAPKIILRKIIDPEIFTSWKDNRLIFDNEPFENIAVKLERRFGTRIIIKDEEIKKKKFTGRFDEVTIEQALGALKFASPFEYQIKHDTIFITKHRI
jgi:transmembrane sensor